MAYIQLLPFKLNSISEGQCLIVFLICILVQAKARTATGMQVDVMEDGVADTDLFALSAIKVAYPIHFAALDWSERKIFYFFWVVLLSCLVTPSIIQVSTSYIHHLICGF
jgi:hypothetical protein